MLNQIEDAIVERIKERLAAGGGKVAVQKGVDGIPQPAVYVSTEAGQFKNITQSTIKHSLAIFVDIVFSYRGADDRERRKGMYLILEGILQALMFQNLDLFITPLEPASWKNTTGEDLRQQGLVAFSLELSTSYTISRINDEDALDLLAVGLNYYLKPGDELVDATDLVALAEH